jgi:predicted dehydrogenase/threonine dehydrogenase-like Zn-dependent dehydrogenase
MKQVLQQVRTGEIWVSDVPVPKLLSGCVLVRIAASLVSAGTERATSEFANKSLLQKARARPELVTEVMGKIRRDGFLSAFNAVYSRLDQPRALGYSSAGTVIGVGEGVTDLDVGDKVACAGVGYAVHAEVACVPHLLVAKFPEQSSLSFEEAAFATVASVCLHGIRTADVKLGDVVAVIGLGLLGQLTVQVLKAAGCRVVGMDIVAQRAHLASSLGADATSSSASEFRDLCLHHSRGLGADAVLITAETASSDPVNLAGEIARDRAVVVAVGTVGMNIQRKRYYQKELDFRISRSYGPGRYDTAYEQKGRDYPIGYVRWTETRNMEAFLQLLADGKLDVRPLITHRFPISRAVNAYEVITGQTKDPFLAVVFTYEERNDECQHLELVPRKLRPTSPTAGAKSLSIGLLGAGSFAQSTLLPAIKNINAIELAGVCTANGPRARHTADKYGFGYCTTSEADLFDDPNINTIVIATRHHLHATQVVSALDRGKHVFCEKPLCLSENQLLKIIGAHGAREEACRPLLFVGFNRRFAPMAVRMKQFLSPVCEPLAMHFRINAGYLPRDHWINDLEQGGGRIIGEVCHFVDLLTYLAGTRVIAVAARVLDNPGQYSDDNLIISLTFANGSQGTITYLANGDKSYSKERLEVFGGGAVAVLEDFRRLELFRHGSKQVLRSRWRQDKGHRGEWEAFARSIRDGGESPIPFDEIIASTLATLRILESRSTGQPVTVDAPAFMKSALYSHRFETASVL